MNLRVNIIDTQLVCNWKDTDIKTLDINNRVILYLLIQKNLSN